MPPKVKYSREQILAAALEMTRKEGIEVVTARELGKRLGVSSRPIFTAFENMEEVHREIFAAAKARYREYVDDFMDYTPAFKRFGTQMIRFAIEEPKLYQLLFMRETEGDTAVREAIKELYDDPGIVVGVVMKDYDLEEELAWKLLCNLTIFSYGICMLCARKVCTFSDEDINTMVGEQFAGLIGLYKSGKYRFCGVHAFSDGMELNGGKVGNLPYV